LPPLHFVVDVLIETNTQCTEIEPEVFSGRFVKIC